LPYYAIISTKRYRNPERSADDKGDNSIEIAREHLVWGKGALNLVTYPAIAPEYNG